MNLIPTGSKVVTLTHDHTNQEVLIAIESIDGTRPLATYRGGKYTLCTSERENPVKHRDDLRELYLLLKDNLKKLTQFYHERKAQTNLLWQR